MLQTLWFKFSRSSNALAWVIVGALFIRLISVIWSQGFAATDDYTHVIGVAYNWLTDPTSLDTYRTESLRNIFYPYIHYLLITFFEFINLHDPQHKMLVIRFLHAVFSINTVYYGYHLAMQLQFMNVNKLRLRSALSKQYLYARRTSLIVAILLAFYWYFPYGSVRNLIEFVCIPFIISGVLYALLAANTSTSQKIKQPYIIFSALFFAIAFMIRFTSILIPLGICLGFLLQGKIRLVLVSSLYFLLFSFFTLGLTDWIAYSYPYASLIRFTEHNLTHSYSYITQPWYTYLLFIIVAFLPPASLSLLWGCIYKWRPYLPYALAIFIFIIFHSLYPNKQERFLLPIVPLVIIVGTIGWIDFSRKKKIRPIWNKIIWGTFAVLNILFLIVATPFYGQKHYVEPYYYLYKKADLNGLIVFDPENKIRISRFYLHRPEVPLHILNNESSVQNFVAHYHRLLESNHKKPNYLIHIGDKHPDLQQFELQLPVSIIEDKIFPVSWPLQLQKTLNPKYHSNPIVRVYKISVDHKSLYPKSY